MGLDMYLYAKHPLYPEREWYWRKANAIHGWFVKNVQDDIDNCGCYPVSQDQLRELLGKVQEVISNPEKAEEILPTMQGCFYGTYEYDEWYFEYLKITEQHLKEALEMPDDWHFVYTSSS